MALSLAVSSAMLSFSGLCYSSVANYPYRLGDFIDLFMAYMVLNTAMKVSPGKDRDKLRATMVMNIIIDFVIGLVPFLGDVADTFFRCNTRNAVALEKMLNARVKASEKRTAALTDRVHEVGSEEALPPAYTESDRRRTPDAEPAIQKPPKTKSSMRNGGGWFGGRQGTDADLERGETVVPPKPPRR